MNQISPHNTSFEYAGCAYSENRPRGRWSWIEHEPDVLNVQWISLPKMPARSHSYHADPLLDYRLIGNSFYPDQLDRSDWAEVEHPQVRWHHQRDFADEQPAHEAECFHPDSTDDSGLSEEDYCPPQRIPAYAYPYFIWPVGFALERVPCMVCSCSCDREQPSNGGYHPYELWDPHLRGADGMTGALLTHKALCYPESVRITELQLHHGDGSMLKGIRIRPTNEHYPRKPKKSVGWFESDHDESAEHVPETVDKEFAQAAPYLDDNPIPMHQAKRLLASYNQRWAAIIAARRQDQHSHGPQIPWPVPSPNHSIRSLRTARINHKKLDGRKACAWNTYRMFCYSFGFQPAYNNAGIDIISAGSSSDLRGLKEQLKLEKFRWHEDRLRSVFGYELSRHESVKAVWGAIQDMRRQVEKLRVAS